MQTRYPSISLLLLLLLLPCGSHLYNVPQTTFYTAPKSSPSSSSCGPSSEVDEGRIIIIIQKGIRRPDSSFSRGHFSSWAWAFSIRSVKITIAMENIDFLVFKYVIGLSTIHSHSLSLDVPGSFVVGLACLLVPRGLNSFHHPWPTKSLPEDWILGRGIKGFAKDLRDVSHIS